MPKPLDNKFHGQLFDRKNVPVPIDSFIVFVAKDDALLDTLSYCHARGKTMECSAEHLAGIDRMVEGVRAWRETHSDQCHTPD